MIGTVFSYYYRDPSEAEVYVVVDETKDDIQCLILHLPDNGARAGHVISLPKKFFRRSQRSPDGELHMLLEAT